MRDVGACCAIIKHSIHILAERHVEQTSSLRYAPVVLLSLFIGWCRNGHLRPRYAISKLAPFAIPISNVLHNQVYLQQLGSLRTGFS
jgi:hypothetical protein